MALRSNPGARSDWLGQLALFFSRQFLLFLGVGVTAATLNWLSRIALSQMMSFEWAILLAYGIGMTTAFFLNKRFVFPVSGRPLTYEMSWFFVINLVSIPFVFFISIELAHWLLPLMSITLFIEEIAHAIAITFPIILSFLGYKFIAFYPKSKVLTKDSSRGIRK